VTKDMQKKVAARLREALDDRGYQLIEADGTVARLCRGEFIPLLSLFAARPHRPSGVSVSQEGVEAATKWLAVRPELQGKASEDDIRRLLTALLEEKSLAGILKNDETRRLILRHAIEYAVQDQELDTGSAEIEWAVDLLDGGVLAADLRGVTRSTVRMVQRLPSSLLGTLKAPSRVLGLLPAILKDVAELPREVWRLATPRLRELITGDARDLDETARVALLDHTLDAILAEGLPLDMARDWIVELLDCQSIRLVIVLYAKIECGVTITDADIGALQASLAGNDLAPVVEVALQRAMERSRVGG